ncbi:Membrane proteins related to metalloendopeptidases [Brachybacterium faecium]|nr:Membrane proteins related to metalloendopeptidases [Brachybacterium faecium]
MSVYFFDNKQQLIKMKNNRTLMQCLQEQEITSDKSDLLKDTLTVSCLYDSELEQAEYIAVRERKSVYSLYKIQEEEIDAEIMNFKGINFGLDELSNYIVKEEQSQKQTLTEIAKQVVKATDGEWHVTGIVNKVASATFQYISVKDALKTIQSLGCELLIRCEISGTGISKKWIELHDKIGKESTKRYEVGSTALKVVRTKNRSNIITSIVGRGKGEDVGDGKGKRLGFEKVDWKTPVVKPKGQAFLELKKLTEVHGIPMKNGGMRRREQVVVFDDIEDDKELLTATYQMLLDNSRPLVQFSSEVIGASSIGDRVSIHDYDKGYHYQTRVFSVKYDRLTNKVDTSLGDNLQGSSATTQLANVQNGVSELQSVKMNFYDSTEVSKWQSDIIRGAKGGSVLLMSPWDAKKGESRQPYQMVIMNKESLKESDHFLVMNSEGIGFINGDFDKDKFETAWTIDGEFNANYIRAGVLSGILIKGNIIKSSDEGDFQIVLDGGRLSFETKTLGDDPENQHGSAIAEITPTYGKSEGSDELKANGVAITQIPGQIFSINSGGQSGSRAVVQVPAESTMDSLKLNLYGEVRVVGDFYVNGIKIDGNGGTGGGNGSGGGNIGSREDYAKNMITETFNVDYDKMYQTWVNYPRIKAWGLANRQTFDKYNNILSSLGVSPTFFWAYEGSEGYNSELSFLNHFYKNGSSSETELRRTAQWLFETSNENGALAWYDVQYPYYTSPKDKQANGNAYMSETKNGMIARVMLQGTAAATWAMFDPDGLKGNVNGVQDYADPFTHQMSLIKSWKKPGGKYGMPVAPGYQITSWFGNRDNPLNPGNIVTHKGMDFADKSGSPIFAAESGEVIASLPTASSGGFGEYIVIKHADDNCTGYGHLTTRMVNIGKKVTKGQQIGTMGSTGQSTGPHLHFSVGADLWGPYQDPAPYLGLKRP